MHNNGWEEREHGVGVRLEEAEQDRSCQRHARIGTRFTASGIARSLFAPLFTSLFQLSPTQAFVAFENALAAQLRIEALRQEF